MMEINDELMTPGCPQCAIKHLSAALYWGAHIGAMYPRRRGMYMVTVACINLTEVVTGYKSHLWYAVGALAAAEDLADGPTATIRSARLMLEERGLDAVLEARDLLVNGTGLSPAEWEAGHLFEAQREMPGFKFGSDLIADIERIRKEYFNLEEAPVASPEDVGEGGECEMATKKAAKKAPAFLKKEDPKAKKAACKGGKCKGKKC